MKAGFRAGVASDMSRFLWVEKLDVVTLYPPMRLRLRLFGRDFTVLEWRGEYQPVPTPRRPFWRTFFSWDAQ
jgi:hypothetical protein